MDKAQIKSQITSPNHKSFKPNHKSNQITMSIQEKNDDLKKYIYLPTNKSHLIQKVQ